MTRRVRGPQRLDAHQLAKLDVVRKRRIDSDNAREELEARIQRLREEFMLETETALKKAVREAANAGVPHSRIKSATNITDHRTYRNRFFGPDYEAPKMDGWEFTKLDDGTIRVDRFLRFTTALVFELQFGNAVVVPKVEEYDEAELAALLGEGKYADEWSLMMLDLREKLNEGRDDRDG